MQDKVPRSILANLGKTFVNISERDRYSRILNLRVASLIFSPASSCHPESIQVYQCQPRAAILGTPDSALPIEFLFYLTRQDIKTSCWQSQYELQASRIRVAGY